MYINIYYLCLHYTYISLYIFTAKIIPIVESNIREKYSFEICRLIMTVWVVTKLHMLSKHSCSTKMFKS